MNIEVWSDVVCPWCYIGKRRLESALKQFEHRDDVTVTWRSFELNPNTPHRVEGPLVEALASKYGVPVSQAEQMMQRVTDAAAGEGITMRFDIAQTGNTFDAHRLIHHASESGLRSEMKERLLAACFTEGQAISDRAVLASLAADVGLDRDTALAMLESEGHAEAVRAEERQAQAYGAGGVPFFVIDQKYGVSGAQPSETLLQVLNTAHSERAPAVPTASDACDEDGCAVP